MRNPFHRLGSRLRKPSAAIDGSLGGTAFDGLVTYGPGTYEVSLLSVYHWGDETTAAIGNYCSIASGVELYLGGGHRTDWVSTYPFGDATVRAEFPGERPGHPVSNGDIVIGNDVWIGSNASLISGVQIGDGAVIAARAHVVTDVPAYSIFGGNPAREIRRRFDEATVVRLLRLAWWDWPPDVIWAARDILCSEPSPQTLSKLEAFAPASQSG